VINLRNFRHVALIEATTFLLLLVASYLKRAEDEPIGVEILGPIHGLLFIAYVAMALVLRDEQGWSTKVTGLILLGAVLPFGGYVVDRWLENRERAGMT
jgi:integral membrane protein